MGPMSEKQMPTALQESEYEVLTVVFGFVVVLI